MFDRSITDKELVSQSKSLCRDYIISRLNQNGLGWSKIELNFSPSNTALSEVAVVLLCLGKLHLKIFKVWNGWNEGLEQASHLQLSCYNVLVNFEPELDVYLRHIICHIQADN